MFGSRYNGQTKRMEQELSEMHVKFCDLNADHHELEMELEELENHIIWLNETCLKEKAQFCGLRKLYLGEGKFRPCYIGFIMRSLSKPISGTNFTLKGYLSDPEFRFWAAYVANIEHNQSESTDGLVNVLHLIDNQVKEDIRRKGVGSAGLNIIKGLAKHLRCSEIYGSKLAMPDTEENRRILTAFYAANGFTQSEDSTRISFDMKNY